MSDTPVIEDDDFLDGCELDFTVEPDDDETAELRALFPSGEDDAALEQDWRALFEEQEELRQLAPLSADAYTRESLRGAAGNGFDIGIADRLRAKGLNVVEVNGWRTRGSSSFFPKGSVDHHTAGSLNGNSPSLGICINGRAGLAGPLCNVFIARDNTVYVVAAGRANHAGTGTFRGLQGNSSMYGVERENTGIGNEPWREDQRVTAALVHAALLEGIGRDGSWVCEHKEWTTRKIDAFDQDGNDMRNRVSGAMGGVYTPPPAPAPGPVGVRYLQLTTPYQKGQDVLDWQNLLIGAKLLPEGSADGVFGPNTSEATKAFQRVLGVGDDGIVGPATRQKVAELIAWLAAQIVEPQNTAKDRVRELQRLVRTADDGEWGPNTSAACSRHMISWKKRGPGITNERNLVLWLQRQGVRFNYLMDEDGLVGPQVNHMIVVVLGQSDAICGPSGYLKACA
jgi:peptidoglycan hydrolase-like protein with peptidoglycan-binding domain